MSSSFSFKMNKTSTIVKAKGLAKNGKLQKYTDLRIVTLMEPYVPFYQGTLRGSAKKSNFGSGVIEYKTPYARQQFFNGRKAGTKPQSVLEGRRWDKRFESDKAKSLAKEIEKYGNTI